MKKIGLVGLLAMFALVSCNKKEMLNENAILHKQRANTETIYVKNVNKEIAGQVATVFMEGLDKVESVYIMNLDSIVDWDGKTAMYIFNFEPTGFVITSADIANSPIVGYSTEKHFNKPQKEEETPDALTNLLAETIIVNNWLQDEQSEAPQNIIQENTDDWFYLQFSKQRPNWEIQLDPDIRHWDPCRGTPNVLTNETETVYGNYCQTSWGQEEPYNYFVINHYPAGCVAVAVAQIMKFHEHPNTFNWSIMPDICTSNYSNISPGDWEVARLIKDIGNNVGMNYTPTSSGAYSSAARDALIYVYGYTAYFVGYNYNVIVNQIINQKCPVYVEGSGSTWSWRWWLFKWWTVNEYENSHAFVIDGFKNIEQQYYNECRDAFFTRNIEFLHYNFGWNGRYNNWFSKNIKDIVGTHIDFDVIIEKKFPNYQYNKKMIFNIFPK